MTTSSPDLRRWFLLNRREVEKQFFLPAGDLKEVVILDGLDLLPDESSLRIRGHDLHGPLPEIILPIDFSGRYETFERLRREAVKLCTVVRFRRELADTFAGAFFLPPTRVGSRCVAGIQWKGRTVLVESRNFMDAHHRLWKEAVRRFM